MQKKKYATIVLMLVGFILFAVLLVNFEYAKIDLQQMNLNPITIASIVALTFLFFILRTLRWNTLLKTQGMKLSFRESFAMVTASLGLAKYSPFEIGDILKVQILKEQYNLARRKTTALMLFDKAADGIIVLVIGILALVLYSVEIEINYAKIAVIAGIAMLVLLFVIYIIYKKSNTVKEGVHAFIGVLKDKKNTCVAMCITLLIWITHGLIAQEIAKLLGIQGSLLIFLAIVALQTATSIMSLIPGGIGVAEVTIAYFAYLFLGITTELAILFSLCHRLHSIIKAAVAYAHILLIKKPREKDA